MTPSHATLHLAINGALCRVRSVVKADGTPGYEFAAQAGPWKPIEANATLISPGVASLLLPDGTSLLARQDVPQPVRPAEIAILLAGRRYAFTLEDPRSLSARRSGLEAHSGPTTLTSPMPGRIVRILLPAGSPVQAKQGVLMVEAMKMQNELKSPKAGTVETVLVAEGDSVTAGQPLAVIR